MTAEIEKLDDHRSVIDQIAAALILAGYKDELPVTQVVIGKQVFTLTAADFKRAAKRSCG